MRLKRHLYTPMKVSFLNNPEAKRQGHLLKCYHFSLHGVDVSGSAKEITAPL